jgi:hypothetical protein
MKRKLAVLILLSVIGLPALTEANEENLQKRSQESLIGIWKGKFEEMPALDIALKVEGGKLVGTAIFYIVQNTGAAPEVKSTEPREILQPSFDGSALSFQVKRKDGSLFKAKVKFITENEAVLNHGDEAQATDDMAIFLTREK